MGKFNREKKRTPFSDYVLLKNMLTSSPDRIKLTLADRKSDLRISEVFSEGEENAVRVAAVDLIKNSFLEELDQELPAFPPIIFGIHNYYFYDLEITSYYYDPERKAMRLSVYLVFETEVHEVRDSPED